MSTVEACGAIQFEINNLADIITHGRPKYGDSLVRLVLAVLIIADDLKLGDVKITKTK